MKIISVEYIRFLSAVVMLSVYKIGCTKARVKCEATHAGTQQVIVEHYKVNTNAL